jgi:hypothetical protein
MRQRVFTGTEVTVRRDADIQLPVGCGYQVYDAMAKPELRPPWGHQASDADLQLAVQCGSPACGAVGISSLGAVMSDGTAEGEPVRGIHYLAVSLRCRMNSVDIMVHHLPPSVLYSYGHRTLKSRLPVRSALVKQCIARLVLWWVTTWESLVL